MIKGVAYDAVSSAAYWESEFEALITQEGAIIFPEYHLVSFKTDVESEYGVAKPDFALIDRLYRRWWVGEAELAHHSLTSHVLPQIQKLAAGIYGARHAAFLKGQSPILDLESLRNMMKGQQPQVLVVVNQPCPSWRSELTRYGALLAVVEIFRSGGTDHVLRVNGDYPAPPPDGLSLCHWDPAIPRFLVVESPAALGSSETKRFEIEYEGSLTDWSRVETRDTVWLSPLKSTPLPLRGKFVLTSEGGRYVLRAI